MNPLLNKKHRKAFSLIEVVVAVGIFAIAIISVIGLLGPINKSVSDVKDFDNASRVVQAVQAELQNMAKTSAGWSSLTDTSPNYLRLSSDIEDLDDKATINYAATNYILFASKDGKIIAPYGSSQWTGNGEKFFEIILIRNWDAGTSKGLSDPTNDGTAGYLAFTIRLRWPAYLPDGTPVTDNTQKSVMLIPAAVTR